MFLSKIAVRSAAVVVEEGRFVASICGIANRFSTKKRMSTRNSSGILSGKVGVNGVNLYYEQAGNGHMPLLLMPGSLGSTQTDFKPQLEKLNRDLFTITAFDPRGYGKSRPPDRDCPIEYLHRDAKDGRDLMKALGFDKFCVLGWSDGGATALILAGTYPKDVHKLVVWGGMAYLTEKDIAMYKPTRDLNNWSEEMKAPLVALYGKEYLEKTWLALLDVAEQIVEQWNGDICTKEAKNIACPTLIFHGEQDAIIPMEHSEFLAKTIKGSRLIKWPKAKHNLHLRYPDEFNKIVEEFLTTETSNL